MDGRSFTERMAGAARLDRAAFDEVEHDRDATGQAAMVVALVSLASAVGAAAGGLGSAVAGLVAAFLTWLLWAGVTYIVGDKLLGGTATWGQLLRTLGFAQSPGVLYVFGAIPGLGWIVRPIVAVWILIAAIVAISEACDFGTLRAILTAVIGWILIAIPLAILTLMTIPFRG